MNCRTKKWYNPYGGADRELQELPYTEMVKSGWWGLMRELLELSNT